MGARLQVAVDLHLEVDVPVAGHQVEHVIEKSHARAARARAGAFEGQLEADVCLAGPALDLGVAAHGSPFSRTRASIDSACTSKPSARASGAPAPASLAAAAPLRPPAPPPRPPARQPDSSAPHATRLAPPPAAAAPHTGGGLPGRSAPRPSGGGSG